MNIFKTSNEYYYIGGIMINYFFIVLGFILSTIGSTYIICYLNLFTIGYKFIDYVNFIVRRLECWYLVFGFTMLVISLYLSGKDD